MAQPSSCGQILIIFGTAHIMIIIAKILLKFLSLFSDRLWWPQAGKQAGRQTERHLLLFYKTILQYSEEINVSYKTQFNTFCKPRWSV
jgi:hypothetical protein